MSTFEMFAMLVLSLTAFVAAYWTGKLRERELNARDARLMKSVARLPERQPEIMLMHCQDRYNYLEIAGLLGLPRDYVLEEMVKAYATLRMQHMPVEASTRRRSRLRLWVARQILGRMTA